MKITIKTPNQYIDGYFRLASGGNFKKVSPKKIHFWVEKAIRKSFLGTHTKEKSPQLAVVVKYRGGMKNETLDSHDFDYLYNTTLVFLEGHLSKMILNKTKKYEWL